MPGHASSLADRPPSTTARAPAAGTARELLTLPDGTVISSRFLADDGPLYLARRGGVVVGSFVSVAEVAEFVNTLLGVRPVSAPRSLDVAV